jgi:hypothetical protein
MLDEATLQPLATRPSPWKMAAYLALTLLVIAGIAWYFRKDLPQILAHPEQFWQIDFRLAALALLALLVTSFVDILIWNRMLGWFTAPLPFRQVAPVYIWSYLARYIPGKVGSLLLRVALASAVQREPVPVLAASAVELALRTASALVLFLLVLWGWAGAQYHRVFIVLIALVPFILLCAHPRVMMPVLNWVLKKMKQAPLAHTLHYGEVLGLFVALAARWALFGLGFYLLARAIFAELGSHLLLFTGLGAGSWALGFLGMSPGGAGIMEAVQMPVLTGLLHMPAVAALILVIELRLLSLLAEGLWALAVIPLWRARVSASAPAPSTPVP